MIRVTLTFVFSCFTLNALLIYKCQADTSTVKLVQFDLNSIPESYFSKTLNSAKQLILNKEWEKAETILSNAIKNTDLRSPLQKAYILQGLLLKETGNSTEAIKAYDRYLRLHAANSDVLFLKAQAQALAGASDKAIESLEEASWFDKFNLIHPSDVYMQISLLYLSQDNKDKAQKYLTKALSKKPDSINALLELARIELAKGNKVESVSYARKALNKDNENQSAKLLLAKAMLTKANRIHGEKEINEAEELAKSGLEQTQSESLLIEAASLFATAKIESNKLDEAKTVLTKYMKKFPNNLELRTLDKQLNIEQQIIASSSSKQSS